MLDRVPRPLWILALLAMLALGLALGVNALLAKTLAVDPERMASLRAGAPAPVSAAGAPSEEDGDGSLTSAEPSERRSGTQRPRRLNWFQDPIVRRNLFDSANALFGKPETPAGPGEPGEEAKKSDLDVVLLSTSVATDPGWSSALVTVSSTAPELYRINDPLLDATIVDIRSPWLDTSGTHHPARMVVLRGGEREYIDAGAAPKPSARRKAPATATERPARSSGRHSWDGIHADGDGKWRIEQGEVDYALANLDKMAREARVVPNFQDDQTNGWKVFSIRRNSALRKMGLKNNDVLTSVNGFDLGDTEKALEVYSKLQTEKSFTLEILRNGEPMTLEYTIQ